MLNNEEVESSHINKLLRQVSQENQEVKSLLESITRDYDRANNFLEELSEKHQESNQKIQSLASDVTGNILRINTISEDVKKINSAIEDMNRLVFQGENSLMLKRTIDHARMETLEDAIKKHVEVCTKQKEEMARGRHALLVAILCAILSFIGSYIILKLSK